MGQSTKHPGLQSPRAASGKGAATSSSSGLKTPSSFSRHGRGKKFLKFLGVGGILELHWSSWSSYRAEGQKVDCTLGISFPFTTSHLCCWNLLSSFLQLRVCKGSSTSRSGQDVVERHLRTGRSPRSRVYSQLFLLQKVIEVGGLIP